MVGASDKDSGWSASIDALARSLASCTKCLEEAKGQLNVLRNENDIMQDVLWLREESTDKCATANPKGSGDSNELSILPGKPSDPEPVVMQPVLTEAPGIPSLDRQMSAASAASKTELQQPEEFELHEMWHEGNASKTGKKRMSWASQRFSSAMGSVTHSSDSNTSIKAALLDESAAGDMQNEERHPKYSKYVLHPESRVRAAWDVLGVMWVCYDVLYLPMQLLNPPAWVTTEVVAWLTRLFWTIDLPLSFASGYIERDGRIQLHPKKILKRYVWTWFFLDLAIITLDWADLAFPDDMVDADTARIGRASRVLRMLRLLRLLRLLRVMQSIMVLAERLELDSERLKLLAEIGKTLTAVLVMAHFIACGWYGIGDASKDALTAHWFQDASNFENDFYTRYVVSLHWALAQFQGGMDEFVPKNGFERTYTVCIVVLTFAVSAGIISRLTSLMTQLYILSRQDSVHFSRLRQYLRQHKISSKLASRIYRSVKFNLQAQKNGVKEGSVELLSMISLGLRIELDFESFSRIYSYHRFFQRYTEECPTCMRKVCHEASNMVWVSEDDAIFAGGEIPEKPRMYIVLEGDLTYINLQGWTARIRGKSSDDLADNLFVCEHALWVQWMHTGLLKAAGHSLICEIDARRFQTIAVNFENADFDPRKYATAYLKLLNTRDVVSDLALQLTDSEKDDLNDSLFASGQQRRDDTNAPDRRTNRRAHLTRMISKGIM